MEKIKREIAYFFFWLKRPLNWISTLVFLVLILCMIFGVKGLIYDPSQLTFGWFTLGAVIAALLIFLRNTERERQDFYLNKAIAGYQNTLEILTREIDGKRTNRRIDWIAAARVVQDSHSLSKKITSKHHLEAHNIYKNKYRLLIGNIMEFDEKGEKLSPAFWYGVDPALSLEEAARKSTKRDPDGAPRLEYIPEKAIFLIRKFTQFPEDYDDPLETAGEFTEREIRFMKAGRNPGLGEYLKHQDKYFSIDGNLKKRKTPKLRKAR